MTLFDRQGPRGDGVSWKWSRYPAEVTPAWIADLDVDPPEAVQAALRGRVAAGWYPYGNRPAGLLEAWATWIRQRQGWTAETRWATLTPSAMVGVNLAIRALAPGRDAVVLTPVYPPLLRTGDQAGAATRPVDWLPDDQGGYALDPARLEEACTGAGSLVVCHPHNPIGRPLTGTECALIADLARRHDLVVISDELWGDLMLDGGFTPMAVAQPSLADRLVVVTGPTKTFNLGGLGPALVVIPDPARRQRFQQFTSGVLPEANVLSVVAAEAAYRHGADWVDGLCAWLRGNRDQALAAAITWPGVRVNRPTATYLWWLDVRDSHLGPDPAATIRQRGGVAVADGADFGAPGHVRVNLGAGARVRQAILDGLGRAFRDR
jgi:cystathionine beta-lyase